MSILKRLAAFLISGAIVFTFAGCGETVTLSKKFDSNAKYYSINQNIVGENNDYRLLWDDQSGEIGFANKKTGLKWTTASVRNSEDNLDEFNNPRLKTPFILNYIEKETYLDKSLNAYTDCMKDSAFSAEVIDNGVKVTYYFKDEELAVPISYSLDDYGFHMSINPLEIQENGNKIYSISFMPFMCSVNNEAAKKSNYLFMPSGSGALIYPKTLGEGTGTLITDQVYGNDLIGGKVSKTNKTDIKMPVFGAKVGEDALFCIIEKGAESAELNASIGSSNIGYSSIYPSFNIRGSYYCSLEVMNTISEGTVRGDSLLKTEISVLYTLLENEKADYMGMADTYRKYLIDVGGLEKSENDNMLNLKFLGGVMSRKFLFGIPYYSLNVTTDFDFINKTVNELYSECDTSLNISLFGFSKTGYTIGEIAGGYAYNKKFGDISQVAKLESDDISVFFNFDVLRFAESGNGMSKGKSALNISKQTVPFKEYDFVTAKKDKTSTSYYLASRDELGNIVSKCVSTVRKWKIDGIGLDTLSNMTYSDYTAWRYISKSHSSAQVSGLMKGAKKGGLNVSSSSANDYAAIMSTHIYDVPTYSNGYQVFDCDIPFYQIVFKGYKSMSTDSVNLVDNREKLLLKAAESGMGLTYTIIEEYDSSLINSRDNIFYNSLYSDIKTTIKEDAKSYSYLFDLIKNEVIVNHECITKNVRLTEYSNGVTVCVNFGDKDYVHNGNTVKSGGYYITE